LVPVIPASMKQAVMMWTELPQDRVQWLAFVVIKLWIPEQEFLEQLNQYWLGIMISVTEFINMLEKAVQW